MNSRTSCVAQAGLQVCCVFVVRHDNEFKMDEFWILKVMKTHFQRILDSTVLREVPDASSADREWLRTDTLTSHIAPCPACMRTTCRDLASTFRHPA